MSKATKLIIATIALGGLGYFLYKKGLFSDKTSEVKMPLGLEVEDAVVDNGKKTAVEPPEKEIVVDYKPLPSPEPMPEPNIPIWKEDVIYPKDELYPIEQKPISIPSYNNPYLYDNLGFRDNTYFDQPVKIDYGTSKYNQEVATDYMQRDMANVRLNQFLYA